MKLEKYSDQFIDNGVEDLETVLELNEKHLEQMGVPLGHKLKIMKKIKDYRKENNLDQPVQVESKPYQKQDLEELPPPAQQPSNLKPADPWTTTANTADTNPENLKEGQFDEQQSHNEFLEALNAWRNAGKEPEKANKDKKSVKFQDPKEKEEEKPKKNFLYTVGDSENFQMDNIPTFEERGQESMKQPPKA